MMTLLCMLADCGPDTSTWAWRRKDIRPQGREHDDLSLLANSGASKSWRLILLAECVPLPHHTIMMEQIFSGARDHNLVPSSNRWGWVRDFNLFVLQSQRKHNSGKRPSEREEKDCFPFALHTVRSDCGLVPVDCYSWCQASLLSLGHDVHGILCCWSTITAYGGCCFWGLRQAL